MNKLFLIWTVLALIISGCAAGPAIRLTEGAYLEKPFSVSNQDSLEYCLKVGDEISIKFYYQMDLNETQTIRPDGKISLQLIDEITAAGKTPRQLARTISRLVKKYVRNSKATVILRNIRNSKIYIGGEIRRGGMLNYELDQTVLQAIFRAGGFLDTARLTDVIIIRRGKDNKPQPFKLDLENPGNDIALAPDDIIYIPRSEIASANLFVSQYIDKIIPISRNMGINYNLGSYEY